MVNENSRAIYIDKIEDIQVNSHAYIYMLYAMGTYICVWRKNVVTIVKQT